MRILLTNDDGITSPGLAALRRALDPLGEVVTIAPDHNNSAVARGITTDRPLHAERTHVAGFEAWSIDGTPVDCVRVALLGVLAPAPQAIVSGVNLGANTGLDVSYSGTVGAAFEGALRDLPSVALSIESGAPAHLDELAGLLTIIVGKALNDGLPPRTVLNINLPDLPPGEIKGCRATRLGGASCSDSLELSGDGVRGGDLRVLCDPATGPPWPGTDAEALAAGYIALTPLSYDLVDPAAIRAIEGWGLADLPVAGSARDRSGRGGRPLARPPMPGFDPVIFDLDGTIVDTVELIRQSFRHAARTVLGADLPDRQLMAGVGQPLMTQMRLLSPDHAQRLYDVYREFNHRRHDELIRPYDGVKAALEQLRAATRRLGLVTSKSADTTQMAFDAVGVGHLFDVVVTAGDTTEHKPSPAPVLLCLERLAAAGGPADPAAAIYIGDSPVDIAAGAAAGLATAAVTWGIFSLDDLLAAGPSFVVETPRELVGLCLTGSARRRTTP